MKERDVRAYVFMRACCGEVNVCRREREGGREVKRLGGRETWERDAKACVFLCVCVEEI